MDFGLEPADFVAYGVAIGVLLAAVTTLVVLTVKFWVKPTMLKTYLKPDIGQEQSVRLQNVLNFLDDITRMSLRFAAIGIMVAASLTWLYYQMHRTPHMWWFLP